MKFLADENFTAAIVRGLLRRKPDLDIKTVRELGLSGAADPYILHVCAQEGRVLITHDVETMRGYAYERVARHEAMPGVIVVKTFVSIGAAVEEILILVECSEEWEFENRVVHVPI